MAAAHYSPHCGLVTVIKLSTRSLRRLGNTDRKKWDHTENHLETKIILWRRRDGLDDLILTHAKFW